MVNKLNMIGLLLCGLWGFVGIFLVNLTFCVLPWLLGKNVLAVPAYKKPLNRLDSVDIGAEEVTVLNWFSLHQTLMRQDNVKVSRWPRLSGLRKRWVGGSSTTRGSPRQGRCWEPRTTHGRDPALVSLRAIQNAHSRRCYGGSWSKVNHCALCTICVLDECPFKLQWDSWHLCLVQFMV